ncbi:MULTISPECIES: hypothetical protein [unclassified Clostridium]|uniref:hypothetical protein n=1 Tax=unclassified Clostridium TaxID=2614128 RepID=UPI00023B0539|nr:MULTISPECIES: hypothetical protein [unclassified Clostridium]EHJ00836.1 hypothetical protein CDLVIII_4320 [Clostridium sp. DL-VIII]OOM77890.1 hypothetical protein CLOBL_27230 [Clostridium sp. BL-8]
MGNNIEIILEKIKTLPVIKSGKQSIISLSSSNVNLSAEDFNDAIEYIWEKALIKILKVEREYKYIIKIYADVTK